MHFPEVLESNNRIQWELKLQLLIESTKRFRSSRENETHKTYLTACKSGENKKTVEIQFL